MIEKPHTQTEIFFGIYALGDELEAKVTHILAELKNKYDEEMKWCKPVVYGQWSGNEHEECFREKHRDCATAYAFAYALVVETFNLTSREAWAMIMPYVKKPRKE